MKILLTIALIFSGLSYSEDTVSVSDQVEAYLQAHKTNGTFSGTVLIRHEDHTEIWTSGWKDHEQNTEIQPDTWFRLGSVTKPFTAALVYKLQEHEKLSIEDNISRFMPDYPNGENISISDLLSHRSGIPNYTALDGFTDRMHQEVSMDDIIDEFRDLSLEFEPGSQYAYSNSGYILLTAVIEEVTGLDYKEALNTFLLEPLGIASVDYETPGMEFPQLAGGLTYDGGFQPAKPMHMSWPLGAGGLIGNADGVLTFIQGITDTSRFPEAALESMVEPVSGNYGRGVALGPVLDMPTFGHAGGINGFASNVIHFRGENTTIVVLSNLETAMVGPITRDLAAIVFGGEYSKPSVRTSVELSPETLEKLTGVYQLAPGFNLTITTDEDRIFAQGTGQPRVEIFPESETEFFIRVVDARIEFDLDEVGNATGLTLYQGGSVIPGDKIGEVD